MRELQTAGTTIVLATHDMPAAETAADRVAILLRGRIAATRTARQLTATGAGLTKALARTEGNSLYESRSTKTTGRFRDVRLVRSTGCRDTTSREAQDVPRTPPLP